jgi:hypothetical protein
MRFNRLEYGSVLLKVLEPAWSTVQYSAWYWSLPGVWCSTPQSTGTYLEHGAVLPHGDHVGEVELQTVCVQLTVG